MSEKIYAITPNEGKQGVNLDRDKYQAIYDGIVTVLRKHEDFPLKTLYKAVTEELSEPFDGSVSWYTMTVKLDMEARGIIEQVPGKKPQHLRLSSQ